jgi:hypothetical protein
LAVLPAFVNGPSPVASVNVTCPVESAGAAPFAVTDTPSVTLSALSVPSARLTLHEAVAPATAGLPQLMPIESARAGPVINSKAGVSSIATR